MKSVTKLCLKALTRLNQTQSKLLNTICQKQKKHPKQDLPSEETPPETARAAHVSPQGQTLQQPKVKKPLSTTRMHLKSIRVILGNYYYHHLYDSTKAVSP